MTSPPDNNPDQVVDQLKAALTDPILTILASIEERLIRVTQQNEASMVILTRLASELYALEFLNTIQTAPRATATPDTVTKHTNAAPLTRHDGQPRIKAPIGSKPPRCPRCTSKNLWISKRTNALGNHRARCNACQYEWTKRQTRSVASAHQYNQLRYRLNRTRKYKTPPTAKPRAPQTQPTALPPATLTRGKHWRLENLAKANAALAAKRAAAKETPNADK